MLTEGDVEGLTWIVVAMVRQDMVKCSFIVRNMKSVYLFKEIGKDKVNIESRF